MMNINVGEFKHEYMQRLTSTKQLKGRLISVYNGKQLGKFEKRFAHLYATIYLTRRASQQHR